MAYFTDQQIIELLLRREQASMHAVTKQLYRQNQKEISQFIFKKGGNQQDAEDIFQEVISIFLDNVWKEKFLLRDAQISTYLFSIASNCWQKEFRSKTSAMKRGGIYLNEQNRLSPDPPDPSQYMIDEQEMKRSLAIFLTLSKTDQDFLKALFEEGLSAEQVRVRFDLQTTNAVKSRKYRIMEKLRDILKVLKQFEL